MGPTPIGAIYTKKKYQKNIFLQKQKLYYDIYYIYHIEKHNFISQKNLKKN